jgi:hypothetical protein
MRVRAARNFKFGGKDRTRGELLQVDDRLGDKMIRTRLAVAVDPSTSDDETVVPVAPTANSLGILRRETRTTAPIPNPPAGPEPLHPALIPVGEDLDEELLDEVLDGTMGEEVRVAELVESTDPNSEGTPPAQRNAAAEDIAKKNEEKARLSEPQRRSSAASSPDRRAARQETGEAPPAPPSETTVPPVRPKDK